MWRWDADKHRALTAGRPAVVVRPPPAHKGKKRPAGASAAASPGKRAASGAPSQGPARMHGGDGSAADAGARAGGRSSGGSVNFSEQGEAQRGGPTRGTLPRSWAQCRRQRTRARRARAQQWGGARRRRQTRRPRGVPHWPRRPRAQGHLAACMGCRLRCCATQTCAADFVGASRDCRAVLACTQKEDKGLDVLCLMMRVTCTKAWRKPAQDSQ